MSKHLVDIDEAALQEARAALDARTIKETVNLALKLASGERERTVKQTLDRLSRHDFEDRESAWR